jgi:hypothetical protein
MRVNSINNYVSQNNATNPNFGGCFYSKPLFEKLDEYPLLLKEDCKSKHLGVRKFQEAISNTSEYMTRIQEIMKTKFSKNTILTTEDDAYSTVNFVLTNSLSDYTRPIKGVHFRLRGSALEGVETLGKLSEELEKVNNYEVEFNMARNHNKGAEFADFIPEKDV